MARNKKQGDKYNAPFATTLRQLIEERNVTQGDIAAVTGVTRQTVSQYCNGISEPGYDTLIKIANYFDVSIDYLLRLSDDPARRPSAVDDLHLSPDAVSNLIAFSRDEDMYNALNLILESPSLHKILNKLKAIPKSISAEIEYVKRLESAYIENNDEPEKKIYISDLGMLGQFMASEITARDLTNEIISMHPELKDRIVVIHGSDAIEKRIDDLGNDFASLLKAETGYFELESIRFHHSIAGRSN